MLYNGFNRTRKLLFYVSIGMIRFAYVMHQSRHTNYVNQIDASQKNSDSSMAQYIVIATFSTVSHPRAYF